MIQYSLGFFPLAPQPPGEGDTMKRIKIYHLVAKHLGERIRGGPLWRGRYKSIAFAYLFHLLIQITQYTTEDRCGGQVSVIGGGGG